LRCSIGLISSGQPDLYQAKTSARRAKIGKPANQIQETV